MSNGSALKQPQLRGNQEQQAFTRFSDLPIELRAAIWKATLRPRTIEIRYQTPGGHGWSSAAKLPLALEVCKESRTIISPLYPLCFGGQPGTHSPPRIRINFAIDTVYLPGFMRSFVPHFIGFMNQFELNQLRSLAIHERHLFYDIRRALRSLCGLQELLIVCIVGKVNKGEKTDRQLSVRIFDKIPHDSYLREKLDAREFYHLEVWEKAICRSVYGYAVEK
jgi:hypothetical protein